MSSNTNTYQTFLDAKAAFLADARNAKATDGIIDGGHEMEDRLVSTKLIA